MRNKLVQQVFFLLLSLSVISCSSFGDGSWKRSLPETLKNNRATKVRYVLDRTHIFGPAGINKAFVVYALPESIATELQSRGLEYLNNLKSTQDYLRLSQSYELARHTVDDKSKEARKLRLDFKSDVFGMYKEWRTTPAPRAPIGERYQLRVIGEPQSKLLYSLNNHSEHGAYGEMSTACVANMVCDFYGDFSIIPRRFKNSERLKNKSLADLNFSDEIKQKYIDLTQDILTAPGNFFGYGESGVLILSPEHNTAILLYRN